MSVSRALEKELILLLDGLENCVVCCESSPQKNASKLNFYILEIYSKLESNTFPKSIILDFLKENKKTLVSVFSNFFLLGEKVGFLIFEMVDILKQIILSGFFNDINYLYKIDLQTSYVDSLRSTLLSLNNENFLDAPASIYNGVAHEASIDAVTSIVLSLSSDLDISNFHIDVDDKIHRGECEYVFFSVDVETHCSISWLNKKYSYLNWSSSANKIDISNLLYSEFLDFVSIYDDFYKKSSTLVSIYNDSLLEKDKSLKKHFSFPLLGFCQDLLTVSSDQKISEIFIPSFFRNRLKLFLEKLYIENIEKRYVSLIRLSGESFLCFFNKINHYNEIGHDCFIPFSDFNKSLKKTPLEKDFLFYDVFVIRVGCSEYIIPKYQVQNIALLDDEFLYENDRIYSYKDHSTVIAFEKIEWLISSYASYRDSSHDRVSDGRKVIFIEQAGLVFGVICDFLIESTIARKVPFAVDVPSLAAFWKTKEGELIGEFTPFIAEKMHVKKGNSHIQARDVASYHVSFFGISNNILIAIEKSIKCTIESVSQNSLYKLTSNGGKNSKFYLEFKGGLFSVLNLNDDFNSKNIERGHFVFFNYPNHSFALYFSSIHYNESYVNSDIDRNVVGLWHDVFFAAAKSQDGKELNVLLESNFIN